MSILSAGTAGVDYSANAANATNYGGGGCGGGATNGLSILGYGGNI